MTPPRHAAVPRLSAPGPRLRPVAPVGTAECPVCARRFVDSRWEQALRVCPGCGAHAPVPAAVRILQVADPGTASPLRVEVADHDPLAFDDGIPYPRRVRQARDRSGSDEAVVLARVSVGGVPVVLASMDFGFLGGSLGGAAGETFARGCEVAAEERRALVAVCTSGGARMQEGIAALVQMARCTAGVAALRAAGLPYVSVLADPCFGGVTASFATQADVVVAEPGARIGFAGGRVIEQATHERLPEGFQTAEFLLQQGMVDAVVERPMLRPFLSRILGAFGRAVAVPDHGTTAP